MALLGSGFTVAAVTSKPPKEKLSYAECDDRRLSYICTNDRAAICKSLCEADCVINCAFPRTAKGEPLASGLDFIAQLFEDACQSGVHSIINISSQSVYSQHREGPALESSPICPESVYAISKYATELMLRTICASVPHVNVRLASLIGPKFNQRLVNKMIQLAENKHVIQVTDFSSKFGFLDREDAVSALVALVEMDPRLWEPCFNIGGECGYTVLEIANLIQDYYKSIGIAIEVVTDKSKLKSTDALCTLLDSTLFLQRTSWRPMYTMHDSICAIARDVRTNAEQELGCDR